MSIVYILISLVAGDLNREEIKDKIGEYSNGLVRFTSSMLQERLSFMLDQKWIGLVAMRRSHSDHFGAAYYHLWPLGRKVLADQIQRLEEIVTLVRPHLDTRTAQRSRC